MQNINETAKAWQLSTAERVGGAVLARRKQLGMTAVELARKTKEFGYPIHRTTITKIETNQRAGKLDLAEIMVLAAALNLPPIMLIFPDGPFRRVEVLPGLEDESIRGALWFTGEWADAREGESVAAIAKPGGSLPIEMMRLLVSNQRKSADMLAGRYPEAVEAVRQATNEDERKVRQEELVDVGVQVAQFGHLTGIAIGSLIASGVDTHPYSMEGLRATERQQLNAALRKRGIDRDDDTPEPHGDDSA